jgi:hypothetical protein
MKKLITFIKALIKKLLDILFSTTTFVLADGEIFSTSDNKLFNSKGE